MKKRKQWLCLCYVEKTTTLFEPQCNSQQRHARSGMQCLRLGHSKLSHLTHTKRMYVATYTKAPAHVQTRNITAKLRKPLSARATPLPMPSFFWCKATPTDTLFAVRILASTQASNKPGLDYETSSHRLYVPCACCFVAASPPKSAIQTSGRTVTTAVYYHREDDSPGWLQVRVGSRNSQ